VTFQVAVKQMRKDAGGFAESELVDAALHEMIMGSKVHKHPHIVEFVGAAIHPRHGILLVYELIDGINMEDFFHFQVEPSSAATAAALLPPPPLLLLRLRRDISSASQLESDSGIRLGILSASRGMVLSSLLALCTTLPCSPPSPLLAALKIKVVAAEAQALAQVGSPHLPRTRRATQHRRAYHA